MDLNLKLTREEVRVMQQLDMCWFIDLKSMRDLIP